MRILWNLWMNVVSNTMGKEVDKFSHTRTRPHARTHTRKRARAHTHTHTHTDIIGFKTFFYVVRHLDSIASYLPTDLHLGFFRSWPSLYPPSSFSSVFLFCFGIHFNAILVLFIFHKSEWDLNEFCHLKKKTWWYEKFSKNCFIFVILF